MRIGMLGRFFPGNWRPPAQEIDFAARHGFAAIQVRCDTPGGIADVLGADPAAVGRAFADAGVECVVELLLRLSHYPSIADALDASLGELTALGARRVHVHPVPGARDANVAEQERGLAENFARALPVAQDAGLLLGVEHNAREHRLLVEPSACVELLGAVPGLSFVWDTNHATAEESAQLLSLADRLSLVHASDTPLPETNHHLPIGRGRVDFTELRVVPADVPVILEIGGLPISGGPGFDTDDVLLESRTRLEATV